jgi:hypothetical protein
MPPKTGWPRPSNCPCRFPARAMNERPHIDNSSSRRFLRHSSKRRENSLQRQLFRFRVIGVDSMAVARLAARRSLRDRAGFRRLLPGDLSAIVAPLFEVATTCPDHTSEKIFRQLTPHSRAFHPSLNSPPARATGDYQAAFVGYAQQAIARLSNSSKPIPDHPRHHGDNNESSTVEVCDGWRRAH